MADVVILAKDAAQVAVGEENGAGTVMSNQRRLLTEMRKRTGYFEFSPGFTVSDTTNQSIDAALPWAESTLCEVLVQSLNPPGKLSFLIEIEIGRKKCRLGDACRSFP